MGHKTIENEALSRVYGNPRGWAFSQVIRSSGSDSDYTRRITTTATINHDAGRFVPFPRLLRSGERSRPTLRFQIRHPQITAKLAHREYQLVPDGANTDVPGIRYVQQR